MPIYLVDTLSTFRLRYAIEANSASDAMDEVVFNEHQNVFDEMSQKHLGLQIIDTQEVTPEELESLVKRYGEDGNDELCSHWMGVDKLVHKVNYDEDTTSE